MVRIEGLGPDDASDDDDRFLGCDLSEYDGGSSVATASAVRLVQLKYSTRHATKTWTAADLARRPSKGQPVIRRLATMHAALVDDVGRQQALDKVTVALVSNRPVAADLLDAVRSARTLLSDSSSIWTKARLRKALGTEAAAVLDRLFGAAGLSAAGFLDFLRALDLTGCGAAARHRQLLALHQRVGDLVLGGPRPGVLGLKELVSQQVMPEAGDSAGIRAEDVLAALGATGRSALFPYPSELRGPDDAVPTTQARDVAAAVLASPTPLLAHGNPGIGKTTTVLGLEAELPAGSHVVVYDCFADGQYHLPNQDRHRYRACLQLANDVALHVGLEPVVPWDSAVTDGQLFDALRGTLLKASTLVPDDAVLVLAVDAADNAVLTARELGQACFVDSLWDMPLPPSIRLVMTARTMRREDVTSRALTRPREIELPAFDAAGSAAMLRRRHSDATDGDCRDFHASSGGVARVQFYALGRATTPREAVEHARTELAGIFDEIVDTALSTTVDRPERARALAAVAVAGRPASVQTVADVLGRSRSDIDSLVRGMHPAVKLVDGRIRFTDEDFDAYLSSRIASEDRRAAHEAFADHLWARRGTSDEAAVHVAVHLDGAGRSDRLIELARDEGPPEVIGDGFVRVRTYRTRVRLAMTHARAEPQPRAADSLQLLLAAADAARSDSSLRDTIRAAPELATLHADPTAVADVVLEPGSERWLGKLHLRAAYVLARHPDHREGAREQLDLARAWLRAWSADPDRSRYSSGFDAEDLAHGALAALLLGNGPLARSLATHWRPATFVDEVTDHVLRLAPPTVSWPAFAAELEAGSASTVVVARALVGYARAGHAVPVSTWRWTARRLARSSARASGSWLGDFCQLALAAGVGRTTIRQILARRIPTVRHLDSWLGTEALLPYLHRRVLLGLLNGRAPDADDLRPDRLAKTGAGSSEESERRVYDQIAPSLVSLLTASARASLHREGGAPDPDATLDVIEAVLSRFRRDAEHRFPEHSPSRRPVTRLALQVAVEAVPPSSTPDAAALEARLRTLLSTLPAVVDDMAPGLWIETAGRLGARGVASALSDDLLRDAAAAVEAAAWPPSERRDLLLEAASTALDGPGGDRTALSADLFERAVVVASSLDVDAAARLRCLLRLSAADAAGGAAGDAELARQLLQAVEAATTTVDEPEAQLPHRLALRVTAGLAPSVGLAAAMRWSDEQRIALDAALEAAVPAAVGGGGLALDEAFTLLMLCQSEAFSVPLLQRTTGAAEPTNPRRCLNRRLPLWARAAMADADGTGSPSSARQLRDWIADERLGAADVVTELQNFELARAAVTAAPRPRFTQWSSPRSLVDVDAVLGAAAQEHAAEHLALLRSAYHPDEVIVGYLLALARREQGGRVQTLTFLASLTDEPYRCAARIVGVALRQLMEQWRSSPSVVSWSRRVLPEWTARHLPELFDYAYDSGQHPDLTLRLPDPTSAVLDRVWIELARQLDQLTPDQLFAGAVALGNANVAGDGRRAAVRWALDRAQSESPQSAPGRLAPVPPPAADDRPFVRVLLAALGHEDARRRWLAARALRDHLLASDSDLAQQLLTAAVAAPADVLDDLHLPGALPRPLTALQWLLSALAQTAAQHPSLLTPLAADLHGIATSRELPHAAIRELARRAALQLARDPASELLLANRPRRCAVAEPMRSGTDRDRGSSRFPFNSMDTLPYWYSPLASTFHDVTTTDVTQRCDGWITGRWGRTWDDDCQRDSRVTRLRDGYRLYSNDHGALPTIETAQTYLEYHAMMLVAGELADDEAVERERFRDGEDSWLDWLSRYLPAEPWIGDERQPVPASALALGEGDRLVGDGGRPSDAADSGRVDAALVAEHAVRDAARLDVAADELVIYCSLHSSVGGMSCSAWTTSALVTPAAVPALIAALHVSQAPVSLPYADDEGSPWGNEIRLPSLELIGWLRRHPPRDTSVDAADPSGFGPGTPQAVSPPETFPAAAGSAGRAWRRVAWAELDYLRPERRGEDGEERGGTYTAVDRLTLTAHLSEREMCLLLVTESRVYVPKRHGNGEPMTHECTHYRVLWPDGREEDVLYGAVRSRAARY